MIDADLPVEPLPHHLLRGDKRARATGYSEAWNSGRFAVPLGREYDEFIQEHLDFTGLNDPHDDDVDMGAHGWNLGWRGEPENFGGSWSFGS